MSNLTIALEGKELEEYIAKRFGKKEHKEYMNEQRLNREKQMQTTTLGIVDTLTRFRFIDEFKKIRPDNFSHEGLHALFEYFEDLSYDIGQPIEFDPIAICCDYREYESFKQLQEDYPNIEDWDQLFDTTTVISLAESDGFIIHQF
jgi:hypothetical protein